MKLDHIGIAVGDLEAALDRYAALLGRPCRKRERVESEGVETAFFEAGAGDAWIELLGSTAQDSPIARHVERRGEGLHHLAFEVEDLEAERDRLLEAGWRFLNETPKDGADRKRILFMHPKDSHGVLVELCQSKPDPAD